MKYPTTFAVLTFIAGYCDTATYIHMDGVFSSHVTGNFVLFAAAIARGVESGDYLKLFTFPVFLFGVSLGVILFGTAKNGSRNHNRLLWAMTLLMLGCAFAASAYSSARGSIHLGSIDVIITLVLVAALAIQNAIHHFVAGPMTTVMTSTVMRTTASLTEQFILGRDSSAPSAKSAKLHPLFMILSFALGCVLAAFTTAAFGLAALALPAVLMLAVMLFETHKRPETSSKDPS